MNTNDTGAGSNLMGWFNDGFAPSLASLDPSRLLMYEINGPLNLAPLYQNNSPIPASLAAFRAIPNTPVLPPGFGPGNNEVVIDINIDQGAGGEGGPGPPGPDGNPGPSGPPGGPGPDGDDVCTCAVEITCSTSYKNTAKCRILVTVEFQDAAGCGKGQPCPTTTGWVDNEVTWEGEHTSTSYFPPGYFSVADPATANGLDGYGGADYTAGVRQSASASLFYEERLTAKKGKDLLEACGSESPPLVPANTCLPLCDEFSNDVWAPDTEATSAYRITWTAIRELTALGYVDDGDEEVTSERCDPLFEDLPLGPTGDTSPTTTIAPPLLCDNGPGDFPIGPEAPGNIPLDFFLPPACCSDCELAGGLPDEAAALAELASIAGQPSRCLFDYIGPPIPDPYPATSASSANATITAVVGNGPITWSMGIEGTYSFLQQAVEDDWTGACNDTKTTFECEWSGTMRWNADITILFVPES